MVPATGRSVKIVCPIAFAATTSAVESWMAKKRPGFRRKGSRRGRNLLERPRRDRGAYTYLFVLFLIDSTVESLDKFGGSNSQGIANAQQRPNGDRPPRLDLLPMASREAKPNHVFLRIPFSLPQLSHTLAEGAKELSFINHVQLCKRVSSGAPRAD
jgi:hypothetical protein